MASPAKERREPCSSGKGGDFAYRACAPFCKVQQRSNHCSFCKCSYCSFCKDKASLPPPPPKQAAVVAVATAAQAHFDPGVSKGTSHTNSGGGRNKGTVASVGGRNKVLASTTASAGAGSTVSFTASIQSVASLEAATRAAEARALRAEARLQAVEKQLALCRHSFASGRGQRAAPPPPARRGAARNVTAAAAARCGDAVDWAQRMGIIQYPELYPGLNVSSSAAAFQLHLHLTDPSSRCVDPRGPDAAEADAAAAAAADAYEAGASLLLLLGVLLCALCNAWSLGYLHPNRRIRALLNAIGCPQAQLVR